MDKEKKEIAQFEEEKLPKSFWWLLAALGVLFVLFLLTEPFYRR